MIETIRCANCGATNRAPSEKLASGKAAICGRCKNPLSAEGHPVTVTDATFGELVQQSKLPALVDVWASWCGPCRSVAPLMEQIAAEFAGRLRVAKINADENPKTMSRFEIQSLPTLMIFRDGEYVDRLIGAYPKQEIVRRLEKVL